MAFLVHDAAREMDLQHEGRAVAAHVMSGDRCIAGFTAESAAHACKRCERAHGEVKALSVSHDGTRRLHIRLQVSGKAEDILAEAIREPYWRLQGLLQRQDVTPEGIAAMAAKSGQLQRVFASCRASNALRRAALITCESWGVSDDEKAFFDFE